ncbi:MAG: hypothetical protein IJ048_14345 [Clostridia bacterium]|nr:hypothetical protein [Clostridia bacterium]
MDRQAALLIYVQAVSREREGYLYQLALKKVRPIVRDMSPAEKEAYLNSQAFSSTLYHV